MSTRALALPTGSVPGHAAGVTFVAAGEAEVGVALAEFVLESRQMACDITAEHRETIRRILYDTSKAA